MEASFFMEAGGILSKAVSSSKNEEGCEDVVQ